MKIISYVDPSVIAATLYLLYIVISLGSLFTLLIYLPFYLKKNEKKKEENLWEEVDLLQNLQDLIESSSKSKYFRSQLAQSIAKAFAFKAGYPMVTVSEALALLKENKIDLPSDIKDFLIESIEFFSNINNENLFGFYFKKTIAFFKKNNEKDKYIMQRTINLLYERFFEK